MVLSAFILGLLGSVHCVVMCGPLTAIFSFRSKSARGVFQTLLYQLGRITVYVVLGAAVGGLMASSFYLGLANKFALVLGIAFLVLAFVYLLVKPAGLQASYLGKMTTKWFGFVMNTKEVGQYKYYLAGLVNGVLPCAMVYVALAGVASSAINALEGASYMLLFGLGTIPALVFVGVFSKYIKTKLHFLKVKIIIPTFLIFTGLLLTLRGLNVDVPFLSSEIKPAQQTTNCYEN